MIKMSDPRKIKREEFIRMALLSSAAVYFSACQSGNNKVAPAVVKPTDSLVKDSIPAKPLESSAEPTFNLYKKGDAQYEVLRKGFNKRINHFPAAIAECRSTEEVSQAMAYAIKNNLPVSIKSGGHSFEGFSSTDESLVINLSSLKEVQWENDDTISVGPGCALSELYDAILPKNKLLAAGSCGGVGIGGLTLGGGYGLFGRKYGLTCDSLSEITMVDGNGKVIHSNDDPELLWACKGGGNGNFGVITSMKFALTDAPAFLQSFRFKVKGIDAQRAGDILKSWFSITANLPLSCFSAFVLNGKSLYILLANCEARNDATQQIIHQLTALVDITTVGKPESLQKAAKVFYGVRQPLYFKNASAGLYKNFDDIGGCIADVLIKVTATPGMIYQVNTLGGKINDSTLEQQSSYPHRDKNYLSELQTYWEQPSREEKMISGFEEVQQIFYGHGIKSQYRNYPDLNFKEWEFAYYGKNYARLQKVKSKYDPQNRFSFQQSIKL
jgi:hypothetical protein